MKPKVIIFDMDGVLFDSSEIAQKYFIEAYPELTKERHLELLTGNFHEELGKIIHLKKEESEEEQKVRKAAYTSDKENVAMFPGAKELLEELHKDGYVLVLNTSAVNRNCLPLLERRGITHLFDFLATAEVSKSKVEKFKMVEEKYGVENKDTIFITDTLGDIREAGIAGVSTVAVTWGAHDRSYFTRDTHEHVVGIVDSFEELKSFIK